MRSQLAYSSSEADDEVVLFAIGQDTRPIRTPSRRGCGRARSWPRSARSRRAWPAIRNPLNGAHLHLTFLERGLKRSGVDDEDALEAVRVVGEGIRRLGALVSEFLDFARPRPLDKRATSVRALCERAAQLVAPAAETTGVTVKLDLPSAEMELDVDGSKIAQVLLNLFRNAIEAAPQGGGGRVVLRARRQPRQAVIEVEDDGPGLASPEAPIFDPFFSTKPQGTGLGLAIAHRIVTDHEGTIDVTSRPGKTLFRVTLPIQLV